MLKLEIVTPEKKVFDDSVESVTVPTASGEAGIMAAHVPVISALKPGILTIEQKGRSERIAVADGFVEVSGDVVSVLTDSADRASEIDAVTARADRDAAEKALAAVSTASLEETRDLRNNLELANARLELISNR